MAGRTTTVLSLLAAAALVACSDRDSLVSTDRFAAGSRPSASGGVTTPGAPSADLQLTGSANTGSPFTDSLFVYSFQVKDIGPDDAPHTTVVDTLPPTVRLWGVEVNVGTPNCTEAPTPTTLVVSCDIGTLNKGASNVVQVVVYAPDSAGAFSNTANVVSQQPDPVLTSNAVTITVQAQVAKPAKVTPPPAPAPVATTAFTTLPANPDGGYVFAGGPSGVGFQFIPTVSGPMADLLTSTQAAGGGRSEFWIYNDDPLNPDHVGTLLSGPMIIAMGSTFTIEGFFFPKGGPVLTAGQKYWVFGFGVTGELSGLWHNSSAGLLRTAPCAIGPFPGIGGYSTCPYPAFQIDVLH